MFEKRRQVNAYEKRDAAMARAKQLIAEAQPLKQKIESALEQNEPVRETRWRRLGRLLVQIEEALHESAKWQAEAVRQREGKA